MGCSCCHQSQVTIDSSKNVHPTIKPTQDALHYVNDTIMENDILPIGISEIILDYIVNTTWPVIKPGIVFFGRCTEGPDEYNLIFLLTTMRNIRVHSKVSYFYQSFDFDSILIWPVLSDSVSISSGSMECVENGLFNEYKITMKDHTFHEDTVGHDLAFDCEYNLTLKLPDNEDCKWSNWNEYINRISIIGEWNWPYDDDDASKGSVDMYRIKKWDDQMDVKRYTKIPRLKATPQIKHETSIESALQEIQNIIGGLQLNLVQQT